MGTATAHSDEVTGDGKPQGMHPLPGGADRRNVCAVCHHPATRGTCTKSDPYKFRKAGSMPCTYEVDAPKELLPLLGADGENSAQPGRPSLSAYVPTLDNT